MLKNVQSIHRKYLRFLRDFPLLKSDTLKVNYLKINFPNPSSTSAQPTYSTHEVLFDFSLFEVASCSSFDPLIWNATFCCLCSFVLPLKKIKTKMKLLKTKKDLHFCKSFCSLSWARTRDPLINSQML